MKYLRIEADLDSPAPHLVGDFKKTIVDVAVPTAWGVTGSGELDVEGQIEHDVNLPLLVTHLTEHIVFRGGFKLSIVDVPDAVAPQPQSSTPAAPTETSPTMPSESVPATVTSSEPDLPPDLRTDSGAAA